MDNFAVETPVPDWERTAAWLADTAADPVTFVEEAFPWGTGELAASTGPESWQQSVLEYVRQQNHVSREPSLGPTR